jgi:type II secretory pathway component PulF
LPTYAYKALTQAGEKSLGTVVAPSRGEAIRRLVASGQNVLDLREEKADEPEAGLGFRFRRRKIRLSTLTRQLATLSASGVPVVQSLNVLIEQTKEPRAVQILTDIRESIEGGSTLADALTRHPRVFPRIMCGMVRVGEMGGTLDEVLLQLAELYEKEEVLKGEVRAALAYPMLVLFLGLSSAVFLIIFLIPRLKELFEGIGQTLPAPTRLLLGISEVVATQGWLLALIAVGAVVAYRMARRSLEVRLFIDRFKLSIPVLGQLIRTVAIARFARLLGTLTRAGISVVEGIDIVQPAVGNEVVAQAVRSMSAQIRSGGSVASVMKETRVFPPLPIQMIAVGEETGRLDQMLLRMADAFEREAATATRVMTSLLAPALILCVAAVVGFIILSMLLPIFQLSSVMR